MREKYPFEAIAQKETENMTEKKPDKELDELKAVIARLREEISGLVAGERNDAGKQAAGDQPEEGHEATERNGSAEGEQDHDIWTDLLRTFDTSRAQGEQVVKNLTAEVEQHPLMSMVAAFGLGYIIAKMWYRGDKQ
jgi:hypothetical protein